MPLMDVNQLDDSNFARTYYDRLHLTANEWVACSGGPRLASAVLEPAVSCLGSHSVAMAIKVENRRSGATSFI